MRPEEHALLRKSIQANMVRTTHRETYEMIVCAKQPSNSRETVRNSDTISAKQRETSAKQV